MPDQKSDKQIARCDASTIVEAWVTLKGMTSVVDGNQTPAVARIAERSIEGLKREPSIIISNDAQANGKKLAPYWTHQYVWIDERKYRVRFGHQYLSIHFVKDSSDAEKYDTYECSLRPQISLWLDILNDSLDSEFDSFDLGSIEFSYSNRFIFSEEDFDLKKYFKIHFGTGVKAAQKGVSKFLVSFSVSDPDVQISLEVDADDSGSVRVMTHVGAIISPENLSLFDKNELMSHIFSTKEISKKAFFDLVTKNTLMRMGAVYA